MVQPTLGRDSLIQGTYKGHGTVRIKSSRYLDRSELTYSAGRQAVEVIAAGLEGPVAQSLAVCVAGLLSLQEVSHGASTDHARGDDGGDAVLGIRIALAGLIVQTAADLGKGIADTGDLFRRG